MIIVEAISDRTDLETRLSTTCLVLRNSKGQRFTLPLSADIDLSELAEFLLEHKEQPTGDSTFPGLIYDEESI
jgi:hypothetical protein